MKLAKPRLQIQRRHLDKRLLPWREVYAHPIPPSGWVKAIRESLGMSARQLGALLGMSSPAITKLEGRERARSITLRDLDRAAEKLGCKVVYALVPHASLEETLDRQAAQTAAKLAQKVDHHMKLEAQGVEKSETEAHIKELAKLLKESLDPRLWEKK